MTLPGEGEIMDMMGVADPDAVHSVRTFIMKQLAQELKAELLSTVCILPRSCINMIYLLLFCASIYFYFFLLSNKLFVLMLHRLKKIGAQKSMCLTTLIWQGVL